MREVLKERTEKPSIESVILGDIPIVKKISFSTGKIELRETSKTKTNMISIQPGDLVISGINAAKGAIAIYGEENSKSAAATIHYSSYQVRLKKADIKYLWFYMRSDFFKKVLINELPGGIKTEIKAKRLLSIKIPLPKYEEQKRIVSKIENLAAKIEKIQNFLKVILHDQSLLLAKVIERVVTYRVLGRFESVMTKKPRNGYSVSCDGLEGGIPVLTLTAVTGFSYTPSYKLTSKPLKQDAHYWLEPDDFLISRSNTIEFVGHASIYSGEPYPCVYPDLLMKVPIDQEKADKKFVLYWLQTPRVREFIMENAKGTSPTMKKITQGVVMDIPFPTGIPLPEQRRIVAYLDGLQAKVDELKQLQTETQQELAELVPSILDKAFKGKL